jgi:predicted outer membrane protein
MLLKRLAVICIPFFFSAAALASTPGAGENSPADAALSRAFSALHAVVQGAINVSDMAAENASSDLVKQYASSVSSGNAALDAKLMALAADQSIAIVAIDPQTEAGKSLIARLEAEKTMLSSLEGDAFDKEYMTLVTNAQQSVIKFADGRIAESTNDRVKEFFTSLKALIIGRNTIAQEIMEKVYGDEL